MFGRTLWPVLSWSLFVCGISSQWWMNETKALKCVWALNNPGIKKVHLSELWPAGMGYLLIYWSNYLNWSKWILAIMFQLIIVKDALSFGKTRSQRISSPLVHTPRSDYTVYWWGWIRMNSSFRLLHNYDSTWKRNTIGNGKKIYVLVVLI